MAAFSRGMGRAAAQLPFYGRNHGVFLHVLQFGMFIQRFSATIRLMPLFPQMCVGGPENGLRLLNDGRHFFAAATVSGKNKVHWRSFQDCLTQQPTVRYLHGHEEVYPFGTNKKKKRDMVFSSHKAHMKSLTMRRWKQSG